MQVLDQGIRKTIAGFQKNEITEYYIYMALARRAKTEHNRGVIRRIADEELRHYHIWHKYSGVKVKPDFLKRWFYIAVSAVFGVTFGIKLMEKGENNAQESYRKVASVIPEALEIEKEESAHEDEMVRMIDEEKLAYMGSMVLGLNDALVEFTGALAGFTLALQNSRLIAMTGLIMGFSASLSMASSEYLSTKTEAGGKSPGKAAFYTGTAYIIAVAALVLPFFIFGNYFIALGATLASAATLILAFTFFFSVVKDIDFSSRFREMFTISMGVAAAGFLIGLVVRKFLGIAV